MDVDPSDGDVVFDRTMVGAIDDALRDIVHTTPGELIVGWVLLAATRTPDGGGQVLRVLADEAMPPWQIKGILVEAHDDVCSDQYGGGGEVG